MDIAGVHALTNDYRNARLVSLREWKRAGEITPRDQGGPYAVVQDAYDPRDYDSVPDQFLLGRSGRWILLSIFFKLPLEFRRSEYIFGTASEVMALFRDLPPDEPVIIRPGEAAGPEHGGEAGDDDLGAALSQARGEPSLEAPIPSVR